MKKTAKKASKSSKTSASKGRPANLEVLLKDGVIIERERLTESEIEVINALTEEEVAALQSVYAKFASRAGARKSPFWRAFCF